MQVLIRYLFCLVPVSAQAAGVVISSSDASWGTKFVEWMQDAINWATGPGLDVVIIAGVLGGLLVWNLAPRSGGLAVAAKAVASALLAIPVIVSVLAVKNSF